MVVMAPSDENECRQMLYTAFTLDAPTAVFTARHRPRRAYPEDMTALPVGQDHIRRQGDGGVAFLAFGSMVTRRWPPPRR